MWNAERDERIAVWRSIYVSPHVSLLAFFMAIFGKILSKSMLVEDGQRRAKSANEISLTSKVSHPREEITQASRVKFEDALTQMRCRLFTRTFTSSNFG